MKRFLILIVLVLGATALWVGGWYYIANRISTEAEQLAAVDGATSPRIACEMFVVSGFPFHFSPVCTNAEITSGDLTLTIPELSATALFYRPTHLQLFARSPARLSDAFTGSAHELRWDNLRASLRLDGDHLARFSMIGDNLVHADALFGSVELARASHLELHLIDATSAQPPEAQGTSLDIYARLDGLAVEDFAIADGEASIDGRLTGLPPLDLLAHPEALRLWQMAGGTATLRQLEAHAQDMAFSASGDATLDDAGRLSATLAVSSQGLVERFPGLTQDPLAAMLLGQPDAQGAYSQNLSARGGMLFVGILPVMAIAPFF